MNINSDVFGKFILTGIMEDIKSCQELLGHVCIELADHRQKLNDVVSTLSIEVLNEGNSLCVSYFEISLTISY